jgi:hypothetical protein
MVWPPFAEKEFDPFEIALSEDLFDRPCFNCSASEEIDWMLGKNERDRFICITFAAMV